tara:strand:- start:4860 stop:6941 length:2082 start_codon:yes stop_codon:yes gene_type:complete
MSMFRYKKVDNSSHYSWMRGVLKRFLPGVMLVAALGISIIVFEYRLMVDEVAEDLHDFLNTASKDIQAKGLEVGIVAQWMADAMEAGLFDDPKKAAKLCYQILESAPQFSGIYIVFRKSPLSTYDEDRVVYFKRDFSAGGKLTETDHFEQSKDLLNYKGLLEFYAENKGSGHPNYYAYYKYDENRFVVGDMRPIIKNGVFWGAAGVDMRLSGIDWLLSKRQSLSKAEFILMENNGKVLAETIGKKGWNLPVSITNMHGLGGAVLDLKLSHQDGKQPTVGASASLVLEDRFNHNVGVYRDPILDESFFIVNVPLQSLDWNLLMMLPYVETMMPVWVTVLKIGITFLISMIVLIVGAFLSFKYLHHSFERESISINRFVREDINSLDEGLEWAYRHAWLKPCAEEIARLVDLRSRLSRLHQKWIADVDRINTLCKQEEHSLKNVGDSVGKVMKSLEDMMITSDALTETMTVLSKNAHDAVSNVHVGQDELAHMQSMMTSLAEATRAISLKLVEMSEKANNIGKVIETITKIADYTHLLSLNAAMEAEKAGEHGTGFSVVAQEIRRLSDQTSFATMDVEQMVQDMQNSVTSGVVEVDKFTEEVKRSVREVTHLNSQFVSMMNGVLALSPRFDSARTSVKNQFEEANLVHEATTHLHQESEASKAINQTLSALVKELRYNFSDDLQGTERGSRHDAS